MRVFWKKILTVLCLGMLAGLAYLLLLSELPLAKTVDPVSDTNQADSRSDVQSAPPSAGNAPEVFAASAFAVSSNAGHDMDRLRHMMDHKTYKYRIRKLSDGSEVIELGRAAPSVTAVKKMPDGTLVMGCFQNFDGLQDFLLAPSGYQPTGDMSFTVSRAEK